MLSNILFMPKQSTQFDFGDSKKPESDFTLYEKIITDRGSKYSVSIGRVSNREEVTQFLQRLKANKKYAKATHNSWAARITNNGTIYETKNDDGETGAGMVILRMLQKENVTDCIVCVTRWFGCTHLHADRFRHLQCATLYALNRI